MADFTLPEGLKPIMALQPRTTNVAITTTNTNFISVKNAQRVFLLLQFTQAVGHATVVTLNRATAVGKITVAPTGAVAITAAMMRWWSNIDCGTLETLAARTAAVAVTCDVGATYQLHVVEFILPALGSTYDVVGFSVGDSSQATNFMSAVWLVQQKYATAVADAPLIEKD